MKKILILVSSLVLLSCNDDDVLTYDNLTKGQKIVGFKSKTENIAYFSNQGVVDFNFPVVLLGLGDGKTPLSQPLTIDYEVDTQNSTAVEGNEYNFVDSSRKITIAAGSDYANINIKVNTGQLNPNNKTLLVLKLKDNPLVAVGNAQKTLNIIFVGCATSLQGNYNTTLVTSTSSSNAGPATVIKISPNVYRSSRLPGIQNSAQQPLTFDFSDVCKDLEIIEWEFEGSYSMFKTGTSSDRPTGVVESQGNSLYFTGVNLTNLSFYVDRNFRMTKI